MPNPDLHPAALAAAQELLRLTARGMRWNAGSQIQVAETIQRETRIQELEGVLVKAYAWRDLIAYGPFDGAAHFGPDFDLEAAQEHALEEFDAARAALGESDA